MMKSITEFFNSENFMPHGHCFLWQPDILWLHIISDACIAFAYFAIPVTLFYFVRKRREIPLRSVFFLFCAFILFCGSTHLMKIWILWHPDYAADGVLKAMTAIASLATLFVMIRKLPQAVFLANPATRLLSAIIESSEDAIVSRDLNGIITSWNGSAQKLFGYTPQEIIGKHLNILIPTHKREEEAKIIEQIRQGKKVETIETERMTKDGRKIPVSLTVSPIYGDFGSVIGASKILRDITERKEVDRARHHLREAQKMESLGQLTGGIAHDFNNLLAVIIGNLDFLAEKIPQNDPLTRYITPSLQAAEHGAELTKQLLAFGRKQALQPKVISMNDLVASFSALVRHTLGERIEITTVLAPQLWNVLVDPSQLQSALLNLAVNARDAMPNGGKLIVETQNVMLDEEYAAENPDVIPGDYVMVAITDSGEGMTQEIVARAFEPFFTSKESGKGSGLGLSMVYGFVKQSAGHVKIYSEPKHGTSVKIYLPCADNNSSSMPFFTDKKNENDSAAHLAMRGKGRLVLVVEDNKEVLALTSSMVEDLGYVVIRAETGDEALKIIQSRSDIDLLLTDVVLPGVLNGPAMAKEALLLRPNLKVLFNSGYAEQAIVQRGLLDEGVYLISKPFRKLQLADKMDEVFNS